MLSPTPTRDPRLYQIAVLSGLLVYGLVALDLEVRAAVAATALATALAAQWAATRIWRLPAFDPRSALISGLSLCLLLRTDVVLLGALAALSTILGKFVVRWGGKHIFNPTNFGLATMMLVSDRVWVSPGQWGSFALFAFFVAGLGGLVVRRAERADVTWAFLACWTALLFARAAWLGDPWAIPLHQLGNGAFLVFAFFMISDPKTTPDSRAGRILFAALVAFAAAWIQFRLFRTNGLIWSLFFLSPLVPAIDRLLPGRRYRWPTRSAASTPLDPLPTREPLAAT